MRLTAPDVRTLTRKGAVSYLPIGPRLLRNPANEVAAILLLLCRVFVKVEALSDNRVLRYLADAAHMNEPQEPELVNLLRSPGMNSQLGGPVRKQ
jgi:hypothetical protein